MKMNNLNQPLNPYREWISKLNFIQEECVYYRNKISHILSLSNDKELQNQGKAHQSRTIVFLKKIERFKKELQEGFVGAGIIKPAYVQYKTKLEELINQYMLLQHNFSKLKACFSSI